MKARFLTIIFSLAALPLAVCKTYAWPAKPTAVISPPEQYIYSGNQANFDGTGSTSRDPNGSIVEYSWTFPPGASETNSNGQASCKFTQPEAYTMKLKVKDNTGVWSDETTAMVFVLDGSEPTAAQRSKFEGSFPNLVWTHWSVTGSSTNVYNCIAWSVGITDEWIWWEIDEDHGDNDGTLEVSDFDAFYDNKGYQVCTSTDNPIIMLYKCEYRKTPDNPDGITHAARRKTSDGSMFESKCGGEERIEHVWNELNDTSQTAVYGEPFRYYESK